MSRIAVWTAGLALAAILCGCEAKIYRAETVLHPDGSISRAVYQPADETPDAAREVAAWQSKTFAPRVEHGEWNDSIRALPQATRDKDRPYFAAWGRFDKADELPQTFRKAAPEGMPDGTLKLDYQQEDLVLVVEHRWHETLTDIVTLDDMHRARRELADQLVPLLVKILDRGLGDEYDTSALVEWLKTTGTPLAFELTDVLFDVGARGEFGAPDKLFAAVEPVLNRHGVSLRDTSGKLLEGDALQAGLANHARSVLTDKLRRRDGQPVRPAVVDEILQWIGIHPVPEGFEKSQRYEDAAKEVVLEVYGSEEGFGLMLKPLAARILGLYRSELAAPPRRFVYTLETPGVIVETSGMLLSNRLTRFSFDDVQAYPFGYTMQCRSLAEQSDVEKKLLGKRALADRSQLIKYVDLLHAHPILVDAMKTCQAEGNLNSLRRQRDKLASEGSDQVHQFDALLGLLQGQAEAGH